jgi:hypothetical protein
MCGKGLLLRPTCGVSLAPFLPSYRTEHQVFRTFVLSIALTLAVGPSATLLCRVWCDAQAAAASGCRHEKHTRSTGVRAEDTCDRVGVSVAAFLREDVQRGRSGPNADHVTLIARYQLSHSTIDALPGHDAGRQWPREERPVPTALRI